VGEVAIIGSGAVGVACAGSVLRQGLSNPVNVLTEFLRARGRDGVNVFGTGSA
jgi:thioredoxin reductase